MSYPLLSGRSNPASSGPLRIGPGALVAILVLVLSLGALAWILRSSSAQPLASVAPLPATLRAEAPVLQQRPDDDSNRLRLAHAEQKLVRAAEELTTARRLLAALSPQLTRAYLQNEKRRADSAWTACENAQRALEEAVDDLRLVATTRE